MNRVHWAQCDDYGHCNSYSPAGKPLKVSYKAKDVTCKKCLLIIKVNRADGCKID